MQVSHLTVERGTFNKLILRKNDARESPLRLIAVHTLACIVGHINVLGEYDSSEKSFRETPDILPPKKKHRSKKSRTEEATVVKTAVDQTTSTIPVAVLVPLCRRTLSGQCIKVDDIKSAVIFNMIQIKPA